MSKLLREMIREMIAAPEHRTISVGGFPIEVEVASNPEEQRGAPGCNEKELPWSWEIYPDLYSSYPDVSSFPLAQNQ